MLVERSVGGVDGKGVLDANTVVDRRLGKSMALMVLTG